MADRAYLVDESGEETLVYAKDLGEADRNKKYRCAGKSMLGNKEGYSCHASMTLALSQTRNNYFTATRSSKHIKYCECCEAEKEKRLVHLDQNCRNLTDIDIFQSLLGEKKIKKSQKTQASDTGEEIDRSDEESEDDIKSIRREERKPRDVHEMYEILSARLPGQFFGNKKVEEWIIDERTFPAYFEKGLKDPQIAVVILRKTNLNELPKEIQEYKDQYYLFRCCFGERQRSLYFMIPKNYGMFTEVFRSLKKEFAVIAEWKKASAEQTYYCEAIQSKKQITLNLDLD